MWRRTVGVAASQAGVLLAFKRSVRSKCDVVDGKDFVVLRRDRAAGTVERSSLQDLCAAVGQARVTLVGEVHDDPIAHALQLRLLQSTDAPNTALSLEQFETDVQGCLSEYLRGDVREQDMLRDCRPWNNYHDYRPLVEHCKENGMPVLASNAPRRYVSVTTREGADKLAELAPSHLPPLPPPPASEELATKVKSFHASSEQDDSSQSSGQCPYVDLSAAGARSTKMLDAQNLWDYTMASGISSGLQLRSRVLHVCGAFHCAHGLGIPEHLARLLDVEAGAKVGLARRSPEGVLIVVCWPASIQGALDLEAWPQSVGYMGDFVVLTDEMSPRSYESMHP